MLIKEIKAGFVGNYHFHSKEDKNKLFYVLQFCFNSPTEEDIFKGINKAIIIPVFTDVETYQRITKLPIGQEVKLTASCSLDTGKIYYKVSQ